MTENTDVEIMDLQAREISRLTSELTAANETVGRLREALDEAPHGISCALPTRPHEYCHNCDMNALGHIDGRCLNPPKGKVTMWEPLSPSKCNCWKSRALSDTPPVPNPVCKSCRGTRYITVEDSYHGGSCAMSCPDCQPTKETK